MAKVNPETGRMYDDTPLTEEQKARASNPDTLRIPMAMAKRHCRGYQENYETLYGFAVNAYVLCARSFRVEESPQGEQGWPGYAAKWTEKNMLAQYRRHLEAQSRLGLTSLDAPLTDDGGTVAETIPDPKRSMPPIEAEEEINKIVQRLKGKERAAMILYIKEGMTYAEAGERIGVTRERVRQLVNRALWRIRMSYAHHGKHHKDIRAERLKWIKADPKGYAAAEKKRLRNQKKGCREGVWSRIAIGKVCSVGWYIAYPQTKTLVGPYASREECEAIIPPPPDGASGVISATRARKAAGLPYPLENSNARRRGKEGWKAVPPEGFTPDNLDAIIAASRT